MAARSLLLLPRRAEAFARSRPNSDRANGLGESLLVLEAHRGGVTLVAGTAETLTHLDTVTALYDRDRYRSQVPFGGQDPRVVSDCFAARALWMLGDGIRPWNESNAPCHWRENTHAEPDDRATLPRISISSAGRRP
jgi:hypothetical protein